MKIPVLLSLLLVSQPLSAADWPHFQGPQRTGVSEETGLLRDFPQGGPKILWEAKLEKGFGGAAVMDGEVFVVDRVSKEKDMLLCLDLATGQEKWRFEHPSEGEPSYEGSRNVPTVEKDAVYFVGSFGDVFRINRETHEADWHIAFSDRYPDAKAPNWGYAQSALVVGDTLVVTPFGEKTGVAGWDKVSGEEKWTVPGVGDSHSSPTLIDLFGEKRIVLLTVKGGGLTTFIDPESGKPVAETDVYFNRIPIPFVTKVDENRLFFTGGYGNGSKMVKIDPTASGYTFEELWKTGKGTQVHPPIVAEGHLFFLANENDNHKVAKKRETGGLSCWTLDGKELWNTGDDPFMGRGGMIYADGMLIIQDGETGDLRLFEADPAGPKLLAEANVFGLDEKERRRDNTFWSPPALSDGHLLLRGQDRLLCVQLKK